MRVATDDEFWTKQLDDFTNQRCSSESMRWRVRSVVHDQKVGLGFEQRFQGTPVVVGAATLRPIRTADDSAETSDFQSVDVNASVIKVMNLAGVKTRRSLGIISERVVVASDSGNPVKLIGKRPPDIGHIARTAATIESGNGVEISSQKNANLSRR